MNLAHDIARCYGNHKGEPCPVRDTCARHTQLANVGYSTPSHMAMCLDHSAGSGPYRYYITDEDHFRDAAQMVEGAE